MRPDPKEVIARLIAAAKLLHANCVSCVEFHHGHDTRLNGLPGWLADAGKDIEAAAALKDAGYAVVPVEPTREMTVVGHLALTGAIETNPAVAPDAVYRAMLRASQEG